MRYIAHVFVGKSFENIVPQIGKETLKFGDREAIDHLRYLVAECTEDSRVTFKKLSVDSAMQIPGLSCREEDLRIEWVEEQQVSREELANYWRDGVYDQILDASKVHDQSELKVIVHVPLYKQEVFAELSLLYEAIANSGRPTSVDFLCYLDDMAPLIDPEYKITSSSSKQIPALKKFRDKYQFGEGTHFVVMQNTSSMGLSLGLTSDSLARVVAWFSISCGSFYTDLFPPTIEYHDVVAFGLSVLYLDKYLYVDYLLQRTLLHAMENAQVNKKDISVNDIGLVATSLLKDHQHVLSQCFETLAKADDQTRKTILESQPLFQSEQEELASSCQSIFKDEQQYGITEKAAILAMLLARTECSLFAQSIFNTDNVTIDDLYKESIDYLIQADQAESVKVNNELPVNPIDEIKDLKTKEINSEVAIRDLQSAIEELETQIQEVGDSSKVLIEDGFYNFKGQKFRLLPDFVEEPLEEDYEAHDVKAESVDLRRNFNAIRNQGSQGSCLAHALTSIFEYILNTGAPEQIDLSEAFLYYNARMLDQEVYPGENPDVTVNTDVGSRFKPAMLSLQRFGLAKESVCPYNEHVYTEKPSDEAYQEAECRKLKKAVNVKRTVRDIKSALEDGYPVAISLTLCESFGKDPHGFISIPTDEEIEQLAEQPAEEQPRHSRHAMVITGYSDSLNMFVVRNSWGESWGDQGYCYVPYKYIEHEKLCNFACIITEVEFANSTHMAVAQIPTLDIDSTDLQIAYYQKKAALEQECAYMEKCRKRRLELTEYFGSLKTIYSASANTLNQYIKANIAARQETIDEKKKQINIHKKNIEEIEENYARYKKYTLVMIFGFLICSGLIFWLWNYLMELFTLDTTNAEIAQSTTMKGIRSFLKISWWWWLFVNVVWNAWKTFTCHRRWSEWREERDEEQAHITRLNKEIALINKEIDEFKYKSYAAFNWIRAVNSVQNYLQNSYIHLISLINNLTTWYSEIEDLNKQAVFATGLPIYQLLDQQALDTYFDERMRNDDVCKVDLCENLDKHEMTEEYLAQYKQNLKEKILAKLVTHASLRDFNMADHALKNPQSSIAAEITREMMYQCQRQADVFAYVKSTNRPIITRNAYLLSPALSKQENALMKTLNVQAEYHTIDNKYCMVILQTAMLDYEECVAFQS